MTWVDPAARQTGDLITAAIWNQDVVENTQHLKDGQIRVVTGSYTGNGADNRNITGVGFTPIYVFIHRVDYAGGNWTFKFWEPTADNSSQEGLGTIANAIQALNADGFQIGTSSHVNNAGSPFNYICIG